MNPDSENFEQLRRLLALKRHEVPPPGYFNNFSSKVVARIQASDHHENAGALEIPWLARLWSLLEGRPSVVGAFGAGVCGLLVAGILNAERGAVVGAAGPGLAEAGPSFFPPVVATVNEASLPVSAVLVSSTNPVAPSGGSLFDQVPLPSGRLANGTERFILPDSQ